jgi:putative DNA primase/helicase
MSELREAAVAYAERDWWVFRIRPGEKIPMDRWVNGGPGEKATPFEGEAERRWRQTPNANIGIATGRGLAVLDIDTHHGGGRPEWATRTLTARTPNGGFHLYYKVTRPIRNSTSKLGPGVDVRGDGGMVVAPPSVLVSQPQDPAGPLQGGTYTMSYEWIDPDAELATIDASLLDPPQYGKPRKVLTKESFGNGERHQAMLSLAGTMRSRGCEYPEIAAALEALNRTRFKPPLEAPWVEKLARSVMQYDPDSGLLS